MSYSHILTGESLSPARPVVRRITPSDLYQALSRGVDDFMAMPSHAIFLCVIYPLLGLLMIGVALGGTMLPLAFPIAAGFALAIAATRRAMVMRGQGHAPSASIDARSMSITITLRSGVTGLRSF